MKSLPSSILLLLLAWCTVSATAEFERRTDINPALIYWQACAKRPELTAEERKLFDGFATAPLDESYGALV